METILELREKLIDLMIEYDKKLKSNLEVEAKYHNELGDKISELAAYEGQILICQQLLKMDENDLDLDVIIENVNKMKENINKSFLNMEAKKRDFKEVLKNLAKYSNEEIQKLDEEYFDIVKKHHPALIVYIPEQHDKAFRFLRSCYILNDIESFNKYSSANILLSTDDITYTEEHSEEEYAKRYQEYIDGYTKEIERIKQFDPKIEALSKTLADDMDLAKNENALREQIYKAKTALVPLINKCSEIFPDEVKFKL